MQHSDIALIHIYKFTNVILSVSYSYDRFFSIGCCSNAFDCRHWSSCNSVNKKKETNPVSLYALRLSYSC